MEEVRQKSWMSRNWGWLLGGGCLLSIIIIALIIGGSIWAISKKVSESEPYTYAYEKALQDEDVKAVLGEPIEGGFVGSNTEYNYNNGKTSVKMTIPISGPLNSGLINVVGTKVDDEWNYSKLYVDINNEDKDINLLEDVNEVEEELEL
jgi:hypothetical protein